MPTDTATRETMSTQGHLWGFLWTLVRTDFKVRYHGTAAGFLWALLKPAIMFTVLLGVFSYIFATDRRYPLNLVIALFLWDFFVESTKVGLTSLHAKGYLITKVKFPIWIIVAASMSNAAITLGVFLLAIFVTLFASGRSPGILFFALFALYILHLFVIVLGFSLGTSVLFLRYRDLNQVWEVLTQAGFFAAPIIYPLKILPERVHFYLFLWPPTPIIEFSRMVLVEHRIPSARAHLCLIALSLVSLILGILVFRRLSPTAAEHV